MLYLYNTMHPDHPDAYQHYCAMTECGKSDGFEDWRSMLHQSLLGDPKPTRWQGVETLKQKGMIGVYGRSFKTTEAIKALNIPLYASTREMLGNARHPHKGGWVIKRPEDSKATYELTKKLTRIWRNTEYEKYISMDEETCGYIIIHLFDVDLPAELADQIDSAFVE